MKKRTVLFIIGALLQLVVIANFVYWYTLLHAHATADAIQLYTANFPPLFRNARALIVVAAVLAAISILCYGAVRRSSASRSFRNGMTGLILADVIVLLLVVIVLA